MDSNVRQTLVRQTLAAELPVPSDSRMIRFGIARSPDLRRNDAL
jgi:hypothetical protein